MRPVLVTGATGFLGKHLVAHLKALGEGPIRVLCRGASPYDADPLVEVVRGDVTNARDVDVAVEGAGYVYHMAGVVSRDPAQAEMLMRVHVEGTRNVCEAALKHGAAKVAAVSSSGTIAVSREPVLHDENSGYKHEIVGRWPYYLSKIFAEKLVFWYCQNRSLPAVVVNPSLLLGPGDDRGSSTGDVELFLDGQILSMPRGGMSFVDARDAAAATVAAMRSGVAGERYLIGGPNWTFRKFIRHLSEMGGVRPPILELPLRGSLLGARAMRLLMPIAGRRFRLDDATIEMASHFWYCDSSKASLALGFRPRDPEETISATIEDIRRRRRDRNVA
jgi:dihydroflavonol-4-reductase